MPDIFKKTLDRLAMIKGLPVVIGLALVIFGFLAQFLPLPAFLTAGQWPLYLGVIIGLGGFLFSDTL